MPKEWNVGVRLHSSADAEETARLREQLEREPHPQVRVADVEPTEMEGRIIDGTRRAAETVCRKFGIAPVAIPRDRIHLVSEKDFREQVSDRAEAKVIFGRVYLMSRGERPVEFARLATHEVAHAISRYELEVDVLSEETRLKMWERRLGAAFQPKPASDPESKTYFNGFNEGVTERFAVSMRKALADDMSWDEAERKELTTRIDYRPQVLLIDELRRAVGESEGIRPREALTILFRDYLQGSFEFLRRLSRTNKQAVKLLATMESDPMDALRVARALGFDECADRIGRSIAKGVTTRSD